MSVIQPEKLVIPCSTETKLLGFAIAQDCRGFICCTIHWVRCTALYLLIKSFTALDMHSTFDQALQLEHAVAADLTNTVHQTFLDLVCHMQLSISISVLLLFSPTKM